MTLPLFELWCAVADDSSAHRSSLARHPAKGGAGDVPRVIQEDADLVARVREGNQSAFDLIVTTYAAEMVQLAAIMLRDRDAGDDAAQEVFVRLWSIRESWVLQGSLRAYLMRAVANHARNVLGIGANRRRLETIEHETLAPSTMEGAEDGSVDAVLWAAVQALPARWRDAVLLRYLQRMSFAEVGETLGISEDAAKKVVRRAVTSLRSTLTQLLDE